VANWLAAASCPRRQSGGCVLGWPPTLGGNHRAAAGRPGRDLGRPQQRRREVEQLVGELVANAVGHTQAPLELTIDTHDDIVRVEIRDQAPSVALGLEHPEGHGAAGGWATTGHADRPAAGTGPGGGKVVWAELRGGHAG
jgi:hypothetical protein